MFLKREMTFVTGTYAIINSLQMHVIKINSNAFKSIKVNFQRFFYRPVQTLKTKVLNDVASFSPCEQYINMKI